jgi:hypothetical protein
MRRNRYYSPDCHRICTVAPEAFVVGVSRPVAAYIGSGAASREGNAQRVVDSLIDRVADV